MKKFYADIKRGIDLTIASQKNCCSIGCSFCCYQTIELMDIENESIKIAIKNLDEKTKESVIKNLDKYWSFFNKHTPENRNLNGNDIFNGFQSLPKTEKIKCPLLIENKCSIYQDRPITCRIHIVENKPELCEEDPYRDSTLNAMFVRKSAVDYVKIKQNRIELKPLPYLISEVLEPNRKLKPLDKIMI